MATPSIIYFPQNDTAPNPVRTRPFRTKLQRTIRLRCYGAEDDVEEYIAGGPGAAGPRYGCLCTWGLGANTCFH